LTKGNLTERGNGQLGEASYLNAPGSVLAGNTLKAIAGEDVIQPVVEFTPDQFRREAHLV